MKYNVIILNNGAENHYQSDSRDSVKHLRDHGGDKCIVTTKTGKTVSAAERGADDSIYHISYEA